MTTTTFNSQVSGSSRTLDIDQTRVSAGVRFRVKDEYDHNPANWVSLSKGDTWDLIDSLTELVGTRPERTALDVWNDADPGTVFIFTDEGLYTPMPHKYWVKLPSGELLNTSLLHPVPEAVDWVKDFPATALKVVAP